MSAPTSPILAAFFVGDDDDAADKEGGSIGAFPPFYSAVPLPLLLQNPLARG